MNRLTVLLLLVFITLPGLCAAKPLDKVTLRWARNKPIIDSIVIEGNSYLSDSRIRNRMYSKVRTLFDVLTGERRSRIQRETLGRDTLEIKYLYYINGFLGVQVDETFEILKPDSTALVRVAINEGNQFFYGSTSVTGTYPGGFDFRFSKIHQKLKSGEPVDPIQINQVVFDMKTILANNGYPYARVDFEIDTLTTRPITPVNFVVEADSLVHFGDVTVEGSEIYPEFVARRELTLKSGDVYRRKAILDSQRRLFESGYFSYLQLTQAENSGDRSRPDFQLKVRERKPYYVSVKTGAGQSELRDLIWDLSLGLGKRNFIGTRRLNFQSDYSFGLGQESRLITHRYWIRYTEPWFLGFRMPVSFTGQYEPPIRSSVQDFVISSWSVSVSTVKWFGDKVKTTAGLEYNEVELSDIPAGTEQLIKEEEGISARRKLYATYRRDSRDNIFIPRRGSLSDISGEFFGGFLGGDDDFYKLEASWGRYQVVWPGWISATRIKGGYATAFGQSSAVPAEERLYLGGASTIRGFRENSLGPLFEDGSVEGARITAIFNQEFRWRTIQFLQALPGIGGFFETLPLYQSVFFDMGNGFRQDTEMKFSNLAYSYGTGFQIMSPAGPIRIDYARRIKTDKYDFASRWHFTILYAF
ncbi:MAG: BamA/TamA family outer membrane protein [Candidatus Zixiibacteriota bacterium]